jgi:ketosteroid isomerase-like protein
MIAKRQVANQYIDFLEKGNISELLKLFTEDAIIDSPIYGIKSAADFYNELSNDTTNSELKLKGIFDDKDSINIALYFNYKWTMKNGKLVNFDVVDIIEFNEENQITKLKIIYDTVKSRGMIDELRE